MGTQRQGFKGGGSTAGVSSGLRPSMPVSSAERSGFIDAERVLSRMNPKSGKGPTPPADAGQTDKIPRGKAQY